MDFEKERSSESNSQIQSIQFSKITTEPSLDGNERSSFQQITSYSSMSTAGKNLQLKRKVRLKHSSGPLTEKTLKGVADYILSGKCKNIILLAGAGISTAAGIPDFRSPVTGLYNIAEKLNIPPESIFDIDYFKTNPQPFYNICKTYIDVLGNAKPTLTHFFIRLLADKNILLKLYTQNVDGMERLAGLESKHIIEAHGTLTTASCINCHAKFSIEIFKQCVQSETISYCSQCNGLVKPDVVFFGERLPEYFFDSIESDCKNCDLMIIAGTSLHVYPISLITQLIPPDVPRVVINKEKVGTFEIDDDNSSIAASESSSTIDIKRESTDYNYANDDIQIEKFSCADEATDETPECMEFMIYDRDVSWFGNTDD
ncbi:hypothetical protein HZS_1327, partial [Henneguya salminicola]